MNETYRTFLRSCTSWQSFAKAKKIEQESGLTLAQARELCRDFNSNRNSDEIEMGTKMEFEAE